MVYDLLKAISIEDHECLIDLTRAELKMTALELASYFIGSENLI